MKVFRFDGFRERLAITKIYKQKKQQQEKKIKIL